MDPKLLARFVTIVLAAFMAAALWRAAEALLSGPHAGGMVLVIAALAALALLARAMRLRDSGVPTFRRALATEALAQGANFGIIVGAGAVIHARELGSWRKALEIVALDLSLAAIFGLVGFGLLDRPLPMRVVAGVTLAIAVAIGLAFALMRGRVETRPHAALWTLLAHAAEAGALVALAAGGGIRGAEGVFLALLTRGALPFAGLALPLAPSLFGIADVAAGAGFFAFNLADMQGVGYASIALVALAAGLVALPAALRTAKGIPAPSFAGILGAGIALRALQTTAGYPFTFSDSGRHEVYVQSVLDGRPFPFATDFFMAYHPPLYYVALAPFYAFAGKWAAPFFHMLVMVALALALDRILARLGATPRARLVAAAVITFLPVGVYLTANVANDLLAVLFATLAVLFALPFLEGRPIARDGLLLGAVAGAAALTKATALPALAVLGIAILLNARRDRAIPIAFAAITGLAFAAPWYLRNLVAYGTPIYSNLQFIDYPRDPGSFAAFDFVPGLGFLFARPLPTDFWGTLLQWTTWMGDGGLTLPASAASLFALEPLVRASALLAGLAIGLVVLLGAARVIWRGRLVDRVLLLTAFASFAALVVYLRSYPSAVVVKGTYLLPSAAGFALLALRGLEVLIGLQGRGALSAVARSRRAR